MELHKSSILFNGVEYKPKLDFGSDIWFPTTRAVWAKTLASEIIPVQPMNPPEKRVFHIAINDIPERDMESYINEIARKFRR